VSYLALTKKLAATVANRQRTSQREAATFDAGERAAIGRFLDQLTAIVLRHADDDAPDE